jgi:uncharacterized protein (TIGR03118 family)
MKNVIPKAIMLTFSPLALIAFMFLIIITSCRKETNQSAALPNEAMTIESKSQPQAIKNFTQTNLVGNNGEYNPLRIDPLLVNAWGIAISPAGTVWISAEASAVSTVYDKNGNQLLPAVTIPSVSTTTGGHPTGQVFNSGGGFRLPNGNPARFIFAGADGIISGWNGGPAAFATISDAGEAYLGIAIANDGADKFLYVANFSENEIEVFDTAWHQVDREFEDPNLPAGYAPFNIQNIDGMLYVMYAKQGNGEEEAGPGNGYVDIYNPDGSLVKRFISRGQLNAPWGVAKAPASFWGDEPIPNRILVGNFGDGRINVYDENGNFLGQLRKSGNPIVIEGLWGISFAPPTATAINPNWLYFAAGPDDEEEGLFGYITK